MKEKKDKWTLGMALFAGFLGVSAILAAPVIGGAWLIKKGLESLGVDDPPRDDVDPYDM